MTPRKLKALLRRRFPGASIKLQCDEDTTPEELRKQGFVCAIVIWCPERNEQGQIVEEGFHDPDEDQK